MLLCKIHNDGTCRNQSLLVGQRDGLACLDCSYCGRKTAETHHRGEHNVYVVSCHKVADRLHTREYLYIMGLQRVSHFAVLVLVADDDSVCVKFNGLLYEQISAVVGCQQLDLEQVAMLPDHVEGLSADGSGGSQYGNMSLFHLFPCVPRLEADVLGRIHCLALVPELEMQMVSC